MGLRRALLTLVVALGTALLVGLGAGPASAHAYLASSNPADGASLAAAPRSIELRFTEHVVLASTEITVTEPDGHRVAPTSMTLVESDEDQEAPATVVATIPALGVGAYHVSWRTLSSDDLHESAGIFAFGVQSEVQAAGPSESNPDLFELVGRWAVLAGIGAGLGAVVVGRLLRRLPEPTSGMPRAWLRRQAFRLLVVGATAALAVALVDLVRFGAAAFTPGYLLRWGLREAALLGAALALRPAPPNRPDRPDRSASGRVSRDVAATTALLGAGLLTVSIGHFGVRGGPTWVVTSTVHLVAALLWAGSVAALALLGVRAVRLGLSRSDVRSVLRGFRTSATVSVVVVAVTGVYLASDVVVSVDAALLTTYGRVLLAKVVLAGLVGLVALATTRALHPRGLQEGQARRAFVAVEAVGLLVVVALAGLLATGQPAVSPRLVSEQAPSVIDDRPVADLQQTLALRPNRPGASVALIDVLDTRRPSPGPVTGVSVTVRGSSSGGVDARPAVAQAPVTAIAVTPSRWSAALELPAGGPVDVDVVVHRRGLDDVRSTVHWVVGPSSSDPAPVVSRAPVSGQLALACAVLAVAAVIGAAWLLVKRRRQPSPAPGRTRTPVGHWAPRPQASAVAGSTDAAQDESGAVAPRSAASR
ncbi:copper resistance protein CopC [Terracoccus sp. 273MFTsu3.1]|uniref:copper resistance CopC/CopD family protein n=1 Tax=Terracoccus sp. 273MFTsu3.1 TaxID=1172188 RepID=UPI00035CFD8B|nr:copper resistance protein CopC [Terracoccus sp. 273MFTsu3.1]